jgi:hypothetical protein
MRIFAVSVSCATSIDQVGMQLGHVFGREVCPLPAFASSRLSFWASADMQEPRQPSRPISSVVLGSSLDQCLVCKALTGNRANKAFKSSQCVVLNIAFIQSKGKFIDIAAKMLWTGMVIDADQAALENRENALNPVGRYVVSDILAGTMSYNIMVEALERDDIRLDHILNF